MYCLLTAFYDPQNDCDFWNYRLGQISHAILLVYVTLYFWGGDRGIGEGVLENNIYCFLLRLTCLLLFIMVELEKLLYNPDLIMLLIILVIKVFQKGTMMK